MAIQQRPQAQPQRASIYLTFKIIQVVHQLRRRLKLRVAGSASSYLLGTATSLGLESKARKTIAKGLSRVGPQERKQLHHASNRICKSRKKTRVALNAQNPGRPNSANPNTSGEEVQHMLRSLDGNIKSPNKALSAIAADDKLFLKQNASSHLEACSLNETIQSLLLVHDAINVLYAARSKYEDGWLIAQGHDIGLNIDEVFIANYEHLLLCLQAQLIDILTRKVVEAIIENRGNKQNRKLLNWFTEFPDNQHPLNTTWPWSIKPSLAVLWGVCWMFYNPPGQQHAEQGNHRVRQERFLQNEELHWAAPQPDEYLLFGMELTGTQSQPAVQQSVGRGGSDLRLQNVLSPGTNAPGSAETYLSGRRPGTRDRSSLFAPSDRRPIIAPDFPSPRESRNTYWDVPQAYNHNHSFSLPEPGNSGIATSPLYAFPVDVNVNSLDPWQEFTQQSLPQRTAAGHLTVPGVPGIRVTGSADSEGFAQFAQPHASSFHIYQPSAQQPQAPLPMNINTNLPNFDSTYIMGNTAPETSPIHTAQGPRHERTPSTNSTSNIPTPVSMSGPRSPLLPEEHQRDRRASVAASIASSYGQIRPHSERGSSEDADDGGSPRINHAYKRSEEPPRNLDGKMICKHNDCANITFDRKCEWSKHMDKHDRPYKCNVKGCEKLQGFTYSGGLLRHEREVHKMHGGTKKSLFCPFTDCKRSSGSGFTRKENLAEHIRRVHRRTSMSSDMGNLIIPRLDTHEDTTTEVHLATESTYQRIVEVREEDEASHSIKRKRISDAGMSDMHDEPDLRAEVKRLRRENEEKDERLRQLEAAVMALQQSRR
ncbi:hypothetical protein K505DRAFT_322637 [Melanomma pulvis-pyrius CBS 109.77]|uniref:C2H2-type domain-containing protein n=1 Tax=Melanomma pulvis-pyrius CBS 109.77 TaxID=1314802 RepID=A0A6A6XMI4_9PLEO|nr:hypothetical protein K505DRAFT_322637 [Melanomma pulvis-pyrius CBS 109.77]